MLNQARNMPGGNRYKGGVGAYRFDNDFDNKPDYKWMRQAIQINQQVFNEWKESQENKNKKINDAELLDDYLKYETTIKYMAFGFMVLL